MRIRTHKMSTTVVYGVVLALFTTFVFFLMNAGIDPRSHRSADFDPAEAGFIGIGFYGLYHTIVIIFFDEDDSEASTDRAADRRRPKERDSYTGFVRQPWYTVFSVGPIWALCSALSIVIWHAFAEYRGIPGTIWGDYSTSLVPALVIFAACWSAVNVGLALASIAEAVNRDRPGLSIAVLVATILIGIGNTVPFMFVVPKLPPERGLVIVALALPITLLALLATRAWAMARVARYDAEHPRRSLRERRRLARFGHAHQPLGPPDEVLGSPPQPPLPAKQPHQPPQTRIEPPSDMLGPGETLLLHFRTNRMPEPQLLIATNRRFVQASITREGQTVVTEQARPGQLRGASSGRCGNEPVTIAHFRDRQDMRVRGGDPNDSRRFAAAATQLARTGRITPRIM